MESFIAESERVNWFEAKRRCKSLHPRAILMSHVDPDAYTAVSNDIINAMFDTLFDTLFDTKFDYDHLYLTV